MLPDWTCRVGGFLIGHKHKTLLSFFVWSWVKSPSLWSWTPASGLWMAATWLGWVTDFCGGNVTRTGPDPAARCTHLELSGLCILGCIRAHVVASSCDISRRFHKEHSAFCWCSSVRCVAEIIITDLTRYQLSCFSHVGPDHRSLFLYLLCVSSNQ